ncbi:MAG: disulfide bond formation protein B [Hyphomicrobiales bacterium]|nr:disulfide bond formation protein B [Hyphomicrobiales bacterium]
MLKALFWRLEERGVWAVLFAATASAILIALAFEHIVGMRPCPLCYRQRWPYYALIALSTAALIALYSQNAAIKAHAAKFNPASATQEEAVKHMAAAPIGLGPAIFSWLGLMAAFVILLVSAGMGAHHAGVEWGWWPGPETCAGGAGPAEGATLLERIQNTRVVRCDEAAGRFLGLSFAGWNAALSAALAAFVGLYFYSLRGPHNFIAAKR